MDSMAKKTELAEQSAAALFNGLSDAKREMLNLRFQKATGQLINSGRLGEVRREVARYKTEIRSREIAAAEAANDGGEA